ncbi:type II secretion system protein N [Sphingomonas arenae]|uniref:type II secretion system protein N n=1 Tax=Sphingomonas arenae TaxID=2812555 RepID=UPI0019684DD1|nr:type II secretion system protein N [Sphingomonas arenae]
MFRWILWTAAAGIALLVLFFPLRLALDAADLPKLGLTARAVSGSIWDGRIGDLSLGRQALGTFDVQLRPGPLLLGRTALRFQRRDDLQGPLEGTLRSGGGSHGVEQLTGRLATASLLAPVPVDALEFRQVTILFHDGACMKAEGEVSAAAGARLGGLNLTKALTGPVSCEGQRVRARLASETGRETLEVLLSENGRYRAFMTLRGLPPTVAAGLGLIGFQNGPEGTSLSMSGAL